MSQDIVRQEEILAKSVELIRQLVDPRAIWLFGSRGKGKARPGSDFDLALEAKRPDMRVELRLKDALEPMLGLYQADIVYLDDVKSDFKQLVFNTGRKIYERV